MKNTYRIVLEPLKGTTVEQIGQDAERMRLLLQDAKVSFPPEVVAVHNGKTYAWKWLEEGK